MGVQALLTYLQGQGAHSLLAQLWAMVLVLPLDSVLIPEQEIGDTGPGRL